MNCIDHKFVCVTRHFGYRFNGVEYVVYRTSDITYSRPISGYIRRADARRCCEYLERLNADKFSKESRK